MKIMKVKEANGKLGKQERVDILWHPLIRAGSLSSEGSLS